MTTSALGRALLVSSDDEPLEPVRAQLASAGYDVRRCLDDCDASFPCVGLRGETCPLDLSGGVDVVVDVRQHAWPHPTSRELGVVCALRESVPLVVVSPHRHPFLPWAAVSADDVTDLAARCEQARHDSLGPHRRAVGLAVRSVLEVHARGGLPFTVDITRQQGRVHMSIGVDAAVDLHAMLATRAAVAYRRLDPAATNVEIEVVPFG